MQLKRLTVFGVALAMAAALTPAGADAGRYVKKSTLEAAARSDNRELCEEKWPKQKKAKTRITRRCAFYWVVNFGYPASGARSGFSHDPSTAHSIFTRFGAADLIKLGKRVESICDLECREQLGALARAAEMFHSAAWAHYSLSDGNLPDDLRPQLRLLLAGEKLPAKDIEGLGAVHLRKLRNAVYARHGRPFQDADLDAFFYEARPRIMAKEFPRELKRRKAFKLLPLSRNPDFDDSMLTRIDEANVATIRAWEKEMASYE